MTAAEFHPGRTYPRCILAIDDDPVLRELLTHHLEMPGCEVRTDQGGADVMSRIGDDHQIMVLDLEMPGMTGFEILEALGKRHATRPMPIIVLTSRTDAEAIASAFEAGAAGYALKPVNWPALRAKISTVFMSGER